MSTDAQDLSPEMQAKAIAAYAQANNLTVSETYLDAGRSGLTLHKRPAMKKLLADVARQDCGFSTILVYDISRWGRFQDTDASAYYEYHCRLHGVAVTYVQELATCTDSPIGSLIKGLKRAMAAEFSRELAIKTRAGQNSALDRGLHMGSLPCIGISRVAVSKGGTVERPLGPFEHKAFAREHVKWVRGPDEEVKLVQEIFNRYAYTDITFESLAHQLQIEGRVARSGKPITTWMLHSLIDCEAFVGNFVWGRWDKGRRRSESEEHFRRLTSVLEPIITPDLWNAAQSKRKGRSHPVRSKEQLLHELRQATSRGSRITGLNLRSHGLASSSTYAKVLGSVRAAFELAGITRVGRSPAESEVVAHRRHCAWQVCSAVVRALVTVGIDCKWQKESIGAVSFVIGTGARVRIHAIWRSLNKGEMMWHMYKHYGEDFDHVLVARHDGDDVRDCLLMNRADYFQHPVWFEGNGLPDGFGPYRSTDQILDLFRGLQPRRSRPDAPAEAG
jgi:DNA invertase Pin-like site-specific DNA recombinase